MELLQDVLAGTFNRYPETHSYGLSLELQKAGDSYKLIIHRLNSASQHMWLTRDG